MGAGKPWSAVPVVQEKVAVVAVRAIAVQDSVCRLPVELLAVTVDSRPTAAAASSIAASVKRVRLAQLPRILANKPACRSRAQR